MATAIVHTQSKPTPRLVSSSVLVQLKHSQRTALNQVAPDTVPPGIYQVLHSPGQPLDVTTRAFMEPRFGHDFSHVRVHTDAQAAESARAMNALAYTVGQDIVFGARQYTPDTLEGQHSLAHELTHVVQQRANNGSKAQIFRKPAPKKLKIKLLLDLSNALLHVLEDEKTARSMMVVFGKATKYLLRSGHDFRISQWFERYTTPTRTDYTACTWFPWGRELDRFPENDKVGFLTIKGRLHPVEKQGGRGIVYKAISPAKKAQYQKMERDFKAGKIKWEELAEYKLLKWDIHTDDISQYCNPFGKYATVIHGHYMLHGTDGEDGDVHPFQELTLEGRKDISHGCVRTSNTDIDWLKNNVPGNTPIHILGEGEKRR